MAERFTGPETGPVLTSTRLAGRYLIGERIGRGGRATVYAARDPLLQRDVAVKVFHRRALDGATTKVQEAEARLLAGLNHYALTTLFDAGVDNTDPAHPSIYLVMEHIPGRDLRRQLIEDGPLTPDQVAWLGFDLAEGLQFVHQHGFLHRDIKPANVLLADRGFSTRIRGKLTDFGIATLIGMPELTEYTSGTAAYLSPEQVDGQNPTPASDVYSLGLVLLEAATGKRAYPGASIESAYARLDRDPHIPLTVPGSLAAILRRMTALQPGDRPDLGSAALAFQKSLVQTMVDTGRVSPQNLTSLEDQRLAAVRRYNILDTPPDDAFDRITELACRLLHVPVALIAIVDIDREWFKSRRGLDVEQIDRDSALCATTVATGEPFTVRDVQHGDAFTANPIVAANPHLHGFASVPLTTHDGHAIGTLCVFDDHPRDFSREEFHDLHTLAAIAVRELDLRLASRRALFNT